MRTGVLISIAVISVASKNLWPFYYPAIYFQGAAIAWVLACAMIVHGLSGTHWPRKAALILFWWAVNDVIEMFAMDRTAFDFNEYITAGTTVLIIIFYRNGRPTKRTKRNERIRYTGYR